MGVAAVRERVKGPFSDMPPGHRFGLYFGVWDPQTWEMDKEREKEKKGGKKEALELVLPLDACSKKISKDIIARQRHTASVLGDRALYVPSKGLRKNNFSICRG